MSQSRWRVLQPAIYLVSVLPAVLCALIFARTIPLPHLGLMGIAVVLIQHAINVFNDETDWHKGADVEKKLSWYHFHQKNPQNLKVHAWTSFISGVGLGLWVVISSHRAEVLWAALPLVTLGFLYNHSRLTLSYSQWGEWVTGICYGPGVFGCMAYVLTGHISQAVILGSLACSCLAVAVLLSHQPPQVLTDFAAGKNSFAVRHGAQATYETARILCGVCLGIQAWAFSLENIAPLRQMGIWGVTLLLALTLPRKISPPLILKRVSIQILVVALISKAGLG